MVSVHTKFRKHRLSDTTVSRKCHSTTWPCVITLENYSGIVPSGDPADDKSRAAVYQRCALLSLSVAPEQHTLPARTLPAERDYFPSIEFHTQLWFYLTPVFFHKNRKLKTNRQLCMQNSMQLISSSKCTAWNSACTACACAQHAFRSVSVE
jgi:hypothetical protein